MSLLDKIQKVRGDLEAIRKANEAKAKGLQVLFGFAFMAFAVCAVFAMLVQPAQAGNLSTAITPILQDIADLMTPILDLIIAVLPVIIAVSLISFILGILAAILAKMQF